MAVIEFKKVYKDMLNFLLNLAEENGCRIKRKEWQSKYNSYVIYDYEPFYSERFNINVTIQGNEAVLKFIQYLYEIRIQQIKHLDSCFYQKSMVGVM